MKPAAALFAAALGCLAFATARADDAAVQQITAAQTALANAKTWRRTNVSTDLDTGKATTTVGEFVQPDLFRLKAPAMEWLSDGKSSYISREGSTPEAAPVGEQKTIQAARAKFSLKVLVDFLKEARVEQHVTLRDVPTTVIAFTIDQDGVVSTGEIWISDADHLPLKIEYESQGERALPSGEVRKVNQRGVGSYEYGPSIKIVMPGK